MEPDLLVQRRLALEVPAVGARRAQLFREVERVVGDALAAELGPGRTLAARLAAATFIAALGVAEEAAAERIEQRGPPIDPGGDRRDPRRRGRLRRGGGGDLALGRRGLGRRRRPPPSSPSSGGGACTAAMFSGRRKVLYSMIEIWIAAATGIASSAPRMPNSVEPKSTEVRTTNGATWTALAWIRGWMTLFSTCW